VTGTQQSFTYWVNNVTIDDLGQVIVIPPEVPEEEPAFVGEAPIVEVPFGEIEFAMWENEPPDLFPMDQLSNWGTSRKLFADALQTVANQLFEWWYNLDPNTTFIEDFDEWELQLGLPVGTGTRVPELRRAMIANRLYKGPYTTTRRLRIVELFVFGTQGSEIILSPEGVEFPTDGTGMVFHSATHAAIDSYQGLPLTPDGNAFTSEGLDLRVQFYVEELLPFTYDVFVASSLGVDTELLRRELTWWTPAGISFTISTDTGTVPPEEPPPVEPPVPPVIPPDHSYGAGAYGSGPYGGATGTTAGKYGEGAYGQGPYGGL